jgi:glucose-6-phosphate 1-dehydrogenase
MDHEEYLKRVKSYIKTPTKDMELQLQEFCDVCSYISGQYDKDESFVELRKHLEELEKDRKEQNRVFYMALPPSVFTTVSQHLKKNCYPKSGIARIIVCSDLILVPLAHANFPLRSKNHLERIWPVRGSCRKH